MTVKHTTDRRVFDLHCDTLTEGAARGVGLISDKLRHFSLDRLPEGMRWCQCTAVFMPDELRGEKAERYFEQICDYYNRQTAIYSRLVTPVTDTATVENALDATPFAFILTVEGGSAIAGKLENLEKLYARGVRMMTLTWNGANEIAGGAATDQGFTPLGKEVVAGMERLGMVVDASHLCERAFWELCEFATLPFAASHSNARAVCGHRRNLTDAQFIELVRRGGLVGINYYDEFLREGGGSKSFDDVLRHIHHFLALDGENSIALGSDFDGADLPPYIDGLDKMGALVDALERSGLSAKVVDKVLFGNANRFFKALSLYRRTPPAERPVLLCQHLLDGALLARAYHSPGEDVAWEFLCRGGRPCLSTIPPTDPIWDTPEVGGRHGGPEDYVTMTWAEAERRFPEIAPLKTTSPTLCASYRYLREQGEWDGSISFPLR